MIVIPAIDIRGGKVVRLFQGDYKQEKVYSDNPAEFAKNWEQEGVKCIHLVDLDAAKEGKLVNFETIKQIRGTVTVDLEYGGGVRSLEVAQQLFDIGINRIILGTAAFDEGLLSELIKRYRDKIAVSVDEDQGYVKTGGWLDNSQVSFLDFCRQLEEHGVQLIVFTDIRRDGTLHGPNLMSIKQVLKATNMNIIVSGGMSTLADIQELKNIQDEKIYGVIIGRALYERTINLKEAIQTAEE